MWVDARMCWAYGARGVPRGNEGGFARSRRDASSGLLARFSGSVAPTRSNRNACLQRRPVRLSSDGSAPLTSRRMTRRSIVVRHRVRAPRPWIGPIIDGDDARMGRPGSTGPRCRHRHASRLTQETIVTEGQSRRLRDAAAATSSEFRLRPNTLGGCGVSGPMNQACIKVTRDLRLDHRRHHHDVRFSDRTAWSIPSMDAGTTARRPYLS